MGSADLQSVHIVQVSIDESLFTGDREAEPVRRQLSYGRELVRLRPGSRMTILVVTTWPVAQSFAYENVVIEPVVVGRVSLIPIWRRLAAAHRLDPIAVITTQNAWSEAWPALFFGRYYGVPVLGQIHADFFSSQFQSEYGRSLGARLRLRIARRLFRHFSGLRVVGQRIADTLCRLGYQPQSHVHVFPVSVALLRQAPAPRPQRSGERHVLFVGRLVPVKNLEDWLRVAARVAAAQPDVIFDIVGDGILRASLEAQARELGIAGLVRFHGFIPNHELPALYGTADVFLLTSHYEGFGRVLVEAYAQGVPAVGTRVAGVEDIIDDGVTGYLCEPGDVEGLVERVLQLVREPVLAAQMGRAGGQRVRRLFDPDELTRKWVALLISYAEAPAAADLRM